MTANEAATSTGSGTPLPRTEQDVLARTLYLGEEGHGEDIHRIQCKHLAGRLSFSSAKGAGLLRESTTEEEWDRDRREVASIVTREVMIEAVKDMLERAWELANNCAAGVAFEAMERLRADIWMLGDEDWSWAQGAIPNHTHYGKPQLRSVCNRFGVDWSEWDDGKWRNSVGGEVVGPDDVP